MEKNSIRREFREIRRHLKGSITEAFYGTEEYKNAEKIFCFYSIDTEIDTVKLIHKALSDGKIVALPYITENKSEMVFISTDTAVNLVPDRYGIPSPIYNEEKITVSDKSTLIIVPGLAFDLDFCRIGYGGGYYDRYLYENIYYKAVGACFEAQITQKLPADENDISVDMIVTEKGIRRKI